MVSTTTGHLEDLRSIIDRLLGDRSDEVLVVDPSEAVLAAVVAHLEARSSPPTVRVLGTKSELQSTIRSFETPDVITELVRSECLVFRHRPNSSGSSFVITGDSMFVPLSEPGAVGGLTSTDPALAARAFDVYLGQWLSADKFWLPHAPVL